MDEEKGTVRIVDRGIIGNIIAAFIVIFAVLLNDSVLSEIRALSALGVVFGAVSAVLLFAVLARVLRMPKKITVYGDRLVVARLVGKTSLPPERIKKLKIVEYKKPTLQIITTRFGFPISFDWDDREAKGLSALISFAKENSVTIEDKGELLP